MESNQLINNKINSINVFDWIDCLLFVDGWNGLLELLPPLNFISFNSYSGMKCYIFLPQLNLHSIILNKQLTFSLVKTIL